MDRAPRLLDVLRERLRLRRASERTAEAYEGWVRRFVRFHGRRHPRTMGEREVTAFLSHLATARRVSASTQNQALSALLFLYRDVLGSPFGWLDGLVRAKRGHRRPTVLSREEAQRVLAEMEGVPRLIALLLYGSGLRISEACALRVKDVDFDRREILVRQGKGGRDRLTVLPALLDEALRAQIERVRAWHLREVAVGRGHVMLPGAFHRKVPAAVRDWRWQWVFPARRGYHDPATQRYVRHHVHETVVQRAVADAVRRAGLTKRATSHTFRHSFATHVLEAGYDVRTVQELMGHKDLSTTMIYLHVLNRGGRGVRSPVDALVGAAPGPEGSPAVPLDSTGARLTSPASLSRGRIVDGRLVKTSWRHDLRR